MRIKTAIALLSVLTITLLFSSGLRIEKTAAYDKQTGEMINVAVFVEFSDTEKEDGISEEINAKLNGAFNTDENGLKNFIYKNSNGRLSVETEFAQKVKIDFPHTRYLPRFASERGEYKEINPSGYDNRRYDENGEISISGTYFSIDYIHREQELVSSVFEKLQKDDILSGADRDKDGYIDAFTLVLSKTAEVGDNEEDWGTIFWPHVSNLFYGDTDDLRKQKYFGDSEYSFDVKKVGEYLPYQYLVLPYSAVDLSDGINTSIICHEFMHVLGAPDYYGYDSEEEYVGMFDVMGKTLETPNLSLSYLRFKMGWLDEGSDIMAIEESGTFTLTPTEDGGEVKAYKIVLSDYAESGDCYYIECRRTEEWGTGLIVYRVNEENGFISANGEYSNKEYGNMYGSPEVYLYRVWTTGLRRKPEQKITQGASNFALLRKDLLHYYTSYGSQDDRDKNLITSSAGINTRITVSIEETDENTGRTEFKVTIPESPTGNAASGAEVGLSQDRAGRRFITFFNSYRKGYAYILVSDRKLRINGTENFISGKYGKVSKIPVSFQKYEVAGKGEGVYVYVCFGDGKNFSEIEAFKVGDPKDGGQIILYVLIGLMVMFIATATVVTIVIIKTRKSKNKEKEI